MQAKDHIIGFLNEIEQLNLHGFEIRQGGQRIAAGSALPFRNDVPHRMYSVSKSVVSLAVGILVGDGKLHLGDHIVPYFEDYAGQMVPDEIARLTVRDLLTMATCYDKTAYRPMVDANWTKPFFEGTPEHAAGTIFTYDTGASQVLGSLVERLSGETLLSFITRRLFDPIGIRGPLKWLTDQTGNPQGGTGLIMPLSDLATLSAFCLSDGRDLIDPDYLRAATSFQIATDTRSMPEEKHGYGYFFWRTRRGFSMYGMGGQMGICLPEADLILATTGDLILNGTGVQPIYDAFFRHLADMRAEASLVDDPDILECTGNMKFRSVSGKRPDRRICIRLKLPIEPVIALELSPDALGFVTETETYTIPCEPDTWTDGVFSPIGRCIASAAMVTQSEYRSHIELISDTSCAIHTAVSLRADHEATVRIQSSVWECVSGFSGTAQGIWSID